MEKYTYNGNIKTTQITTDENGVVVSKQEEIIVDWTDKDLYDALNKVYNFHLASGDPVGGCGIMAEVSEHE